MLQGDRLMTDSEVATNMNAIIHTPPPSSTWLRCIEAIALLSVGASGATHLAALVEHRGAVARCSGCRASTELTVHEAMMRIMASVCNGGVVRDACPDGGQGEEDAHNGEHHGADLGDLFENEAMELQSREDT